MKWFVLLVALVAVAFFIAWISAKSRKKDRAVEKFVCDVCHGSDCECRRIDTPEE